MAQVSPGKGQIQENRVCLYTANDGKVTLDSYFFNREKGFVQGQNELSAE